jgi:uridine kinase
VAIFSQDSFYKSLTEEQLLQAQNSEYNFDHPDAFDYDLFYDTVDRLKKGKGKVQIPDYSFKLHKRLESSSQTIFAADVIIVEGILIFYTKKIRQLMDMKIFVAADPDTRLIRRSKN